jgi:acyl carrier protein
MATPAQQIESFIVRELREGDATPLARHESLLEAGILDSLGLFQLIAFLEESFGVTIAPEDLLAENFQSVDRIETLVKRHAAARA